MEEYEPGSLPCLPVGDRKPIYLYRPQLGATHRTLPDCAGSPTGNHANHTKHDACNKQCAEDLLVVTREQ